MAVPDLSVQESTPQSERRPALVSVIQELAPDQTIPPLHAAAMAADACATTDLHLKLLWSELTRGISRIVDSFFTDERCYLLLALNATPTPIEGRRLEILEAVLIGSRQKNIAMDKKLAPSTVALNSRLALESLGLSGKPSRAHPLLMLAAQAAANQLPASAKCSVIATEDQRELRVVAMARPDVALSKLLPSAELAVIRSLVEGLCYREIAQRRGTSTRTIANQISAVFRRLRVSGRNELVQRLFVDENLGHSLRAPSEPQRPPGLAVTQLASLGKPRRSA